MPINIEHIQVGDKLAIKRDGMTSREEPKIRFTVLLVQRLTPKQAICSSKVQTGEIRVNRATGRLINSESYYQEVVIATPEILAENDRQMAENKRWWDAVLHLDLLELPQMIRRRKLTSDQMEALIDFVKKFSAPGFVHTPDPTFQVGQIVMSTDEGHPLRSGSSLYGSAVVVSSNPLVLVSHGGDMKWTATLEPAKLKAVGAVSHNMLRKCMLRLTAEELARLERGFYVYDAGSARAWFVPMEKVRDDYAAFVMTADKLSREEALQYVDAQGVRAQITWFGEQYNWLDVATDGRPLHVLQNDATESVLASVRNASGVSDYLFIGSL